MPSYVRSWRRQRCREREPLPPLPPYAGRFEVRPGDGNAESERVEVFGLPGTAQSEGDAVYYAFSTRFAADWPHVNSGCCIVAQWRASNWSSGWPPLMMVSPSGSSGLANTFRILQRSGSCRLPDDGQWCSTNVGYPLLTAEYFHNTRGMWHDWIVYVDWTATDTGRLKVWHRLEGQSTFTEKIDKTNVPTLKKVDGQVATVYSKFGLYRTNPQSVTHVLYNDSYCVARLFEYARTCLPS